jgi:hypothetical protein
VRRAFWAANTDEASVRQIYDWAYPRRRAREKWLSQALRHSVRRILLEIADPIGRTKHNAIIWKLREPLKRTLRRIVSAAMH